MTAEKLHQYIQLTAIVLGAVTPCVLLAGYAWHLGYTMAFGLDTNLISRGFGDVITEAWLIGVLLLGQLTKLWWYPIVFFTTISVLLLAMFHLILYMRSKGNDPTIWKITKETQGPTTLGLTLWYWKGWWETVAEAAMWAGTPLIILALAGFIAVVPYQHGTNEGKKQINQLKQHGCKSTPDQKEHIRCVTLFDISVTPHPAVFSGILVSANSSHLALFNNGTLEVFPLTDRFKLSKVH